MTCGCASAQKRCTRRCIHYKDDPDAEKESIHLDDRDADNKCTRLPIDGDDEWEFLLGFNKEVFPGETGHMGIEI